MSKFAPENGDVSVIGHVDFITRNSLGSCGIFDAAVSANNYSSVAQNLLDPQMRFCCKNFADEINDGDAVTADISSENDVLIAVNITKL